jgi:hypothetical protein
MRTNGEDHAAEPSRARRGPGRPRFIRWVLRAYACRVATGDVDALADMTRLAAELDDATSQAAGLRKAGYSWAEIAAPPRHHPAGSPATLGSPAVTPRTPDNPLS